MCTVGSEELFKCSVLFFVVAVIVIVVIVVFTRRKNPFRTKKVDCFQRYRILRGKEHLHLPLQLNM